MEINLLAAENREIVLQRRAATVNIACCRFSAAKYVSR